MSSRVDLSDTTDTTESESEQLPPPPKKNTKKTKKTREPEPEEEEESEPAPPPKKSPKLKFPSKKTKKTEEFKPAMTFDDPEVFSRYIEKMVNQKVAAMSHVEKEEDSCSVTSIKSSKSTKSTKSIKDKEGYLSKGQRMYVLQAFTIAQLRMMRTKKGRSPTGETKKDLVYSSVNLVKTGQELLDFILTSDPNFEDDE